MRTSFAPHFGQAIQVFLSAFDTYSPKRQPHNPPTKRPARTAYRVLVEEASTPGIWFWAKVTAKMLEPNANSSVDMVVSWIACALASASSSFTVVSVLASCRSCARVSFGRLKSSVMILLRPPIRIRGLNITAAIAAIIRIMPQISVDSTFSAHQRASGLRFAACEGVHYAWQ